MDREAASEHEMTETISANAKGHLLNRKESGRRYTGAHQRPSIFLDWLRQLRLQIFLPMFRQHSRWKDRGRKENPKVVMRSSRPVAALHALFHLIPLTGAIILLCLHWTNYWIGWDLPDSTTLQFVAKLHELLMQYSVVEIIIYMIRGEAVRGVVPFGALSGAVQSTKISYLWSMDFLSLWTSPALRGWRKALFVLGIPLLMTITALVGPSSAVLMIPRPNCPKSDPTERIFAESSIETLFPSCIGHLEGLALDLKSFSADVSDDKGPPMIVDEGNRTYMLDHNQLGRPLRTVFGDGSERAIATAPTRLIVDSLLKRTQRMTGYMSENGTISMYAPQPLVEAACTSSESFVIKNLSTTLYYIRPDMNTSVLFDLANISSLIPRVSGMGQMYFEDRSNSTYQYYDPIWMSDPKERAHLTTAVFFRLKHEDVNSEPVSLVSIFNMTNTTDRDIRLSIKTCTLLASWSDTEVIVKYNRDDNLWWRGGGLGNLAKQVTHSKLPSWKASNGRPIILNMTDVEPLGNATGHAVLAMWKRRTAITAFSLAASFAAAISGLPYNSSLLGDLGNSQPFMYLLQDERLSDAASFTLTNIQYGYGYGVGSTSVTLSTVVLSLYSAITTLYLLYILITGSTSTAWNSGIELIALALHSKSPGDLPNTTAGINCMRTLSQSVGIRVNAEEKLELVFGNDPDRSLGDLRKIQKDKAY